MTYEPIHFTADTCFDEDPVYCRIPDAPLLVLKFGSSVLRTAADLPRVAGEIYRLRRAGKRLIVVVSALAGETDALFGLANEAGGAGNEEGVADLVSLGEEKTAALLKLTCGRLGLDARMLRPEELSIRTAGGGLESDPAFIDLPALSRLTARHDLLIMPGFVGIDENGVRALLGRGGSDFTAIFVGGEAGAECVRLYKDVDGVFDHDPADTSEPARKYDEVSWADCLEVARPLLQPRSMDYARARGVRLEVEAIGSNAPTRVGPLTRPPRLPAGEPRLRVAIAGFGTVGQALLARLRHEPRFEVVALLAQDPEKPRDVQASGLLTTSIDQFLNVEADILVEVTSDVGLARELCQLFLARGRHVVTASKKLVAGHLHELVVRTDEQCLRHSASVGGGTPALETVKLAREQGEICEVRAVLNGTVNFVLGELAAGAGFEEAVANARRAGFAEAEPSEDLSGRDVDAKLRILAAAGFAPYDRLDLQIEPLDDALAARIRASRERWVQLATLVREDRSVSGGARFIPTRLVPDLPPLPRERNFLQVRLADGRFWVASGRGAGGVPTAEAIIADLYDIARSGSRITSPATRAAPERVRMRA